VVRHAAEASLVRVGTDGPFARLGAAVRYGFTPGQETGAPRDQTFDMHGKRLLETTPLFQVRDEAAQTCGVYDSDGTPALALKKLGSFRIPETRRLPVSASWGRPVALRVRS
jgi:hypothetical protein